MATVGVALVGYGFGNRAFHGPLIRETEGLEIRAVLSTNPDRQQQAHQHFPGVRIYDDYDALLADKHIDLVVISTPPFHTRSANHPSLQKG
jgi:scyllo-inositol 2-dehydrogenase (NADP+)